jgi:hypothetical protein
MGIINYIKYNNYEVINNNVSSIFDKFAFKLYIFQCKVKKTRNNSLSTKKFDVVNINKYLIIKKMILPILA